MVGEFPAGGRAETWTSAEKASVEWPFYVAEKFPGGEVGKFPGGEVGKFPGGEVGKFGNDVVGKFGNDFAGKFPAGINVQAYNAVGNFPLQSQVAPHCATPNTLPHHLLLRMMQSYALHGVDIH